MNLYFKRIECGCIYICFEFALFIALNRMVAMFERFIWMDGADHHRYHLVDWNTCCRSMTNGALGIKKIRIYNKALLGKWLWRFGVERDSLRMFGCVVWKHFLLLYEVAKQKVWQLLVWFVHCCSCGCWALAKKTPERPANAKPLTLGDSAFIDLYHLLFYLTQGVHKCLSSDASIAALIWTNDQTLKQAWDCWMEGQSIEIRSDWKGLF